MAHLDDTGRQILPAKCIADFRPSHVQVVLLSLCVVLLTCQKTNNPHSHLSPNPPWFCGCGRQAFALSAPCLHKTSCYICIYSKSASIGCARSWQSAICIIKSTKKQFHNLVLPTEASAAGRRTFTVALQILPRKVNSARCIRQGIV
jgi:hypothetical protein